MEPTHKPLDVNAQIQAMSDQINRLRMMGNLGQSFGGLRDMYEVLGYKRNVGADDYFGVYRRQDIASRIIRAFPQATWRGNPIISDGPEKTDTSFQRDVNKLDKKLSLWSYCERADRLASIGRYGLLILGVNDGAKMSEPLVNASELHWLKAIKEQNGEISTWNQDPSSQNFGKPVLYNVTFGSSENQSSFSVTQQVHASRVIHIAEFLEEDEVYGVPRLESVFNRLQDLEKVIGGSGEMFWLGARNGLKFIADKEASFSDDERSRLEQMAEDYQHSLRRTLTGKGLSIDSIGTDVASPAAHVDALLDLIAGAVGIPKRILVGSEAGQLASSQDETNWISRIEERRMNFAEPTIIRQLLNRLVSLGVIAAPSTPEYGIDWNHDDGLSEVDRATVGNLRAQSLAAYSNSIGASLVVPETEFREKWLGLEPVPEGGFDEELPELDETDEEPLSANQLHIVKNVEHIHEHREPKAQPMTEFERELLSKL